jgi:hypothetical protein
MFHKLNLAFRQIFKDRLTAFLHFMGLSLSIGICLLIGIWLKINKL